MATRIAILNKTTDYRVTTYGTDGSSDYVTVAGTLTTTEITGTNVLDGMIDAQNDLGASIQWSTLTVTSAQGTSYNHEHGGYDRWVVIDLDNADGPDFIALFNWVSGTDK